MAPRTPFRVALTIDAEHPDRPSRPGIAESMVEVLERERVPASFFVQGRWAQAYPALVAAIAAGGHLVGNHSHHHAPMPAFTAAGFRADVEAAAAAIGAAGGGDPRPWFRCPFGRGAGDRVVTARLAALGYRASMHWDVDALDWDARAGTEIEERVVDGVLAHGDGAVVLLHSWPAPTAEALPGIVARLRDAGAGFVRLDELGS